MIRDTKNGRDGTRRTQRQIRISERQALQLRRAAIQTLRECDAVLGYKTKIVRVVESENATEETS